MAAYESHEPPPFSSSSLCHRWRYDVFLSYIGFDPGIYALSEALHRDMTAAGVKVYYDADKYQLDSSIEEIEYSRVLVIIFSEDYVTSDLCLEKLARIKDRGTTFQQPVIRIIYRRREFVTIYSTIKDESEARAMNEGLFFLDGKLRWMAAFKEAENFPAFEYRDDGFNLNSWPEFIAPFLKYIKKTLNEIQEYERRSSILGIVDDGANGRQIGNLYVYNIEIGKGSNGTIVFEGTYSGRPVAVKRLPKTHHGLADKEIQILIKSDEHQNIVRYYGEENDRDFVYLALQRCTCNLADLIQIYSYYPSQNTQFSDEYNKVWLDSVKNIMGDINLWKANGRPSPLLLELMRDVVAGLVHLHKLKIIHRDIKPQNVLIKKEEHLLAKLSDMGISKPLHLGESSLGPQATVCGTSGWKAPERLCNGRQTRALDLFSLGCVLFFCITGGRHPFGDKHFERDGNIANNRVDFSAVEYIPEAEDLFSHLLNHNPQLRPKASLVLDHPLFWDSEKRLSFIRDTSDWIEFKAGINSNDPLLNALENIAPLTFDAPWDTKMERKFIDNIVFHRRYNFESVRDLLRVMRNKLNHYKELPTEIQDILGLDPEGFDDYFASRFPRLLIEVYKVMGQYCQDEDCFKKYLKFKV